MKKTVKVTRKPDGKGLTGNKDVVAREFLVEIREGNAVIDSAYFPTKAEAEQWARQTYELG